MNRPCEVMEQAFDSIEGLGRPVPDAAALAIARPELRSIVTDAPDGVWRASA